MSRIRRPLIAMFACLGALVMERADAQSHAAPPAAREKPDPEVEAARKEASRQLKVAELDAWLRRLSGRFIYEGIYDPGFQPARGEGDCIGVGNGPGVQCVIHVRWPEFTGDGILPLAPAMFLYGLDPQAAQIRYLRVTSRSIAEEVRGSVSGSMATFKTGCVAAPVYPPCRRIIRIEAKPGRRVLHMWDDTELLIDTGRGPDWVRRTGTMFTLRRTERPGVGSEPPHGQ